MSFTTADYIAMQARLQRNLKPGQSVSEPPRTASSERKIQDDIEEWMNSQVSKIWWDRKRMDKPTTSRLGIPDFVGCYNGVPFGIEVKRPGEKPTTDQLGELKWMELAGAKTAVVYSKEEAVNFLEPNGLLVNGPSANPARSEENNNRKPEAERRLAPVSLLACIRETLEYYSETRTYVEGEYGYQMIAPIEFDKGEKARKALECVTALELKMRHNAAHKPSGENQQP